MELSDKPYSYRENVPYYIHDASAFEYIKLGIFTNTENKQLTSRLIKDFLDAGNLTIEINVVLALSTVEDFFWMKATYDSKFHFEIFKGKTTINLLDFVFLTRNGFDDELENDEDNGNIIFDFFSFNLEKIIDNIDPTWIEWAIRRCCIVQDSKIPKFIPYEFTNEDFDLNTFISPSQFISVEKTGHPEIIVHEVDGSETEGFAFILKKRDETVPYLSMRFMEDLMGFHLTYQRVPIKYRKDLRAKVEEIKSRTDPSFSFEKLSYTQKVKFLSTFISKFRLKEIISDVFISISNLLKDDYVVSIRVIGRNDYGPILVAYKPFANVSKAKAELKRLRKIQPLRLSDLSEDKGFIMVDD